MDYAPDCIIDDMSVFVRRVLIPDDLLEGDFETRETLPNGISISIKTYGKLTTRGIMAINAICKGRYWIEVAGLPLMPSYVVFKRDRDADNFIEFHCAKLTATE